METVLFYRLQLFIPKTPQPLLPVTRLQTVSLCTQQKYVSNIRPFMPQLCIFCTQGRSSAWSRSQPSQDKSGARLGQAAGLLQSQHREANKQPSTLTTVDNRWIIDSPAHLTCYCILGGSRSTWSEPTQAQHAASTQKGPRLGLEPTTFHGQC